MSELETDGGLLRDSAHIARAQADTLLRTIDALARDPRLDAFLPNVLREIAQQLRAQGAGVWITSADGNSLEPAYYCEWGVTVSAEHSDHPAMRQVWSLRDEHPMVQEMTRTRQPLAIRVATDHVMRPEVRNYLSAKRISAALVVPIFMQDRMVGILTARRDIDHDFDADDMRVAQALAHQASLAIELTRLAERGRLAAVAEERTRLAREIHDSLAQAFTATIIQIEAARRATPAQLSLHLDRAAAAARVGLTEARQSVQWLRAESVADVDALPMLRSLISRVQLLSSTTIAATFDDAECILPIRQAEALVQVAQEALMNTWRHAPGSAASLRLRRDHRGVTLIVEDGGPGFDPAAAHDGFGIAIMRERLAAVRGVLEIASGRERGTTVIARLPLESRTVATGRST